jgi:endonuclease YncB( thermonuclease family)
MRSVSVRASAFGAVLTVLAPAALAAECRLDPASAGPVARVTDGRTLVLADGRTVRLATIEVPPMPRQGAPAPQSAAETARANDVTLTRLVAGNHIALAPLGSDRHGRVLARAYLARNETWQSIEVDLVAAGQAFVSPYAGNQNCVGDLIAAERRARASRLGLWRSELCSQGSRQPDRRAGCARTLYNRRGQGCVCARERRYDLCQLRSPVERGLHRYHIETK